MTDTLREITRDAGTATDRTLNEERSTYPVSPVACIVAIRFAIEVVHDYYFVILLAIRVECHELTHLHGSTMTGPEVDSS